MKKVKKALLLATMSLAATHASASGSFQLSLGSLSYDYTVETSVPAIGYSSTSTVSDSGSLIGLSFVNRHDTSYSGLSLYLPNTVDDAMMVEVSSHHMLSDIAYVGLFGGIFSWISQDTERDIELDHSGLSYGLSGGLLLLNDKIDINAKYRMTAGSGMEVTGYISGYKYTQKSDFDSTFQVTMGYNFGF